MMPKTMVRLSAGREEMSDETQALCFLAGANSIFYGPKLLTTPNPGRDHDMRQLPSPRPQADGLDAHRNCRANAKPANSPAIDSATEPRT